MALAHSKTYNFEHFEYPYDATGSTSEQVFRKWCIAFKNMFISAGWTVMGSHAPTSNGLDNSGINSPLSAGVDHWGTFGDIYNSSGERRWIVLQCPAAMGLIQVCVASHYAGTSNQNYINVWTSSSGGFMAGNGGTDGTTANPPTATDSFQHTAIHRPFTNSTPYSIEAHAAWSTDGTQFFFFSKEEQALTLFWAFCKLDNAPAALQDGMVWYLENVTSPQIDLNQTELDNGSHYTSAQWVGVVSGTLRSMYNGGRGWNNVGIQSQIRIPLDRKTPVGPCEMYISTAGIQGYYGTIPDMYWTPNNHFLRGYGDTVGGAATWFSGGSLIIPWDSSQPLPRIR